MGLPCTPYIASYRVVSAESRTETQEKEVDMDTYY